MSPDIKNKNVEIWVVKQFFNFHTVKKEVGGDMRQWNSDRSELRWFAILVELVCIIVGVVFVSVANFEREMINENVDVMLKNL